MSMYSFRPLPLYAGMLYLSPAHVCRAGRICSCRKAPLAMEIIEWHGQVDAALVVL